MAKQSRVFHTMCRHAGFRWGGSWAAGTHSWLRSTQQWRCGRAALWVVRFVLCFLLICIVVVAVPFAVLLNCPYPDPLVSACFFPFSSAPRQGEGRPRGAFVASHSQTITQTCGALQHPAFLGTPSEASRRPQADTDCMCCYWSPLLSRNQL